MFYKQNGKFKWDTSRKFSRVKQVQHNLGAMSGSAVKGGLKSTYNNLVCWSFQIILPTHISLPQDHWCSTVCAVWAVEIQRNDLQGFLSCPSDTSSMWREGEYTNKGKVASTSAYIHKVSSEAICFSPCYPYVTPLRNLCPNTSAKQGTI